MQVAPTASGSVTNAVAVEGGGQVTIVNDRDEDTVTIAGAPDLTLTKAHGDDFARGLEGTYFLTVSNVGVAGHTGEMVVTDVLPAALTPATATGTGWSCEIAGQTVTCRRSDPLPDGAATPQIFLTVRVAATAPATVTNTATVRGAADPNPANDGAADETAINDPADRRLTKTASGPFRAGQTATYLLRVANLAGAGPALAETRVVDTLPAGLTYVSATGDGWVITPAPDGSQVEFLWSDPIDPGAQAPDILLTVAVALNAPSSVTNVAEVSPAPGTADESALANNSVSTITAIVTPTPTHATPPAPPRRRHRDSTPPTATPTSTPTATATPTAHGDPRTDAHADPHADRDRDADADGHPHRDADADPHGDRDRDHPHQHADATETPTSTSTPTPTPTADRDAHRRRPPAPPPRRPRHADARRPRRPRRPPPRRRRRRPRRRPAPPARPSATPTATATATVTSSHVAHGGPTSTPSPVATPTPQPDRLRPRLPATIPATPTTGPTSTPTPQETVGAGASLVTPVVAPLATGTGGGPTETPGPNGTGGGEEAQDLLICEALPGGPREVQIKASEWPRYRDRSVRGPCAGAPAGGPAAGAAPALPPAVVPGTAGTLPPGPPPAGGAVPRCAWRPGGGCG